MFGFEKIDLTFSFNPIIFFSSVLLIGGYTFFVYRYTVPAISLARKIILISLRVLAILLLLFIIFEPILTLAKKTIVEPVNLIFADNSRSILINDGTNRDQTIKNFLQDFQGNNLSGSSELYSFGSKISNINFDSLEHINFSEGSTNFSKIFSETEQSKNNISSIVIISDGVITDGSDPLYTADKLSIPVFTIGVGDTTKRNDIEIRNVLFNEFIYAETPTTIIASIANTGFAGSNVNISLYENDILLEQKSIILNDGIQNVEFTYTPKTGGEKKLSAVVSNTNGEFTFANNKKVFFINVLSNKIKVLIVAGSPSPDLSFVKNSLKSDENLTINSITQIGMNRYLENNNRERLIDSADILFLTGFPSAETSDELLRKISRVISEKNKPFFITLSRSTDFNKLKQLQSELPFIINRIIPGYSEVQPYISLDESKNPLLQNNSQNAVTAWNNLPPVYQSNTEFKAKPESDVISKIKINNTPVNKPLIVTRRLGGKRSIAVIAEDTWKWKLQTTTKELDLFDRFILSSVKWLNTSEEQKQVTIKSSKKLYSLGEEIEFTGQVYDETFDPVSDAEIKVKINHAGETYNINLSSLGNGLYEGTFQTNKTGDYIYTGDALQENKILGSDAGSFNIGEVDIEMINPRMNYEFLTLLARQTGGEYFDASNYVQLFDILKKINEKSSREKIDISEISLWSSEWLMAAVILLLGLEWFLRKRAGML
jgi:hypothetical protein